MHLAIINTEVYFTHDKRAGTSKVVQMFLVQAAFVGIG